MRQLSKIQRTQLGAKRISPTMAPDTKPHDIARGKSLQPRAPHRAAQKARQSAYRSGILGLRPIYIRKGRAAPKWQNFNETQKQYKSLQIIKSLYGNISHKKLLITRKKAKGYANVVSKLETRLDIIVYRLQFANSITEARDLIKKGFISVNSKPITFSGFFVQNGSSVSSYHVSSVFNRISWGRGSHTMPHFLYHTSYLSGVLLYNPCSITPLTETPIFPHFRYFNASLRPRSLSHWVPS